MSEIITNNTDRQKVIHLHTSGETAPGVGLLNEGEIAVSSHVSGASIFTLQRVVEGGFKVVKFITKDAIDLQIGIVQSYIDGAAAALTQLSAYTETLAPKEHEHDTDHIQLARDLIFGGKTFANSADTATEVLSAMCETIATNTSAIDNLAKAAELLKLTVVHDDIVCGWTETTSGGTELHLSATPKLIETITKIENTAIVGIESGATSGVIVNDDNQLNFTNLTVNAGDF